MKSEIHPSYQKVKVTCACGASFQVGSTSQTDMTVEICSACHPFYTGQQKLVETGRLDRYKQRLAAFEKLKKTEAPAANSQEGAAQPEKSEKKTSNAEVLAAAKKVAK